MTIFNSKLLVYQRVHAAALLMQHDLFHDLRCKEINLRVVAIPCFTITNWVFIHLGLHTITAKRQLFAGKLMTNHFIRGILQADQNVDHVEDRSVDGLQQK
jgi:hypothetical protein